LEAAPKTVWWPATLPELLSDRDSRYHREMQPLPHTKSCFVCGEANPAGLRLIMETDGRLVQVRWEPRLEHVGFVQTVHGGLIATVLDEVMVWACAIQTRRFSYCAELNVRYQNPVRPGQPVWVLAEMTRNQRNRLFQAEGRFQDDHGQVLASATGKYLPIKGVQVEELLGDAVGNMADYVDLNGSRTGVELT
jgi:uncharacterized protein (TIGR00369 family)